MKRVFAIFLSVISIHFLAAQSCPNIDFSMGDFTNWQGQTGTCCPIITPTTGLVAGRHTIISTNGTDPNTGNVLQLIPPGYNYSAKLGNVLTGNEAEGLSYTYTVDSSNFIFYMNYAVVLEDPGHSPMDQPMFEFMAKDTFGNIIPLTVYQVSAGQGIPGFQTYGGVVWKDWDIMAMDFTAYMGQQVTIAVRTGDCNLGGHFGYGYVIGGVSGPELKAKFCEGSNTASAEAHDGFKEYLWSTGDTVSSIMVSNTLPSLECQVKTYGGYTSILHFELVDVNINPVMDWQSDCNGNIGFMDSSIVNDDINAWHWDFGDGNTGAVSAPMHTYAAPGNYTAQLVVTTAGGCSDSVTQLVSPMPIVNAGTDTSVCAGSMVTLFGNGTAINYSWNNAVTDGIAFIPLLTNTYTLIGEDANGCEAIDSVNVTVLSLPTVDLGIDTVICEGSILNIDAGNPGSTFIWNQASVTQTIQIDTAGIYSVLVSNIYGCESTDSIQISVFNLPIVNLGIDTNICGNGILLDAGNTGSSYLWSDGSSNQFFQADSSGNYHVIVTDLNGCNNSDTILVEIHSIPSVNFILETDSICIGHSSFLLTGGSPAGGQYTGTGIFASVFYPLTAGSGSHSITYLYTDIHGCSNSANASIEVMGCLGLESLYETSVEVYPNPSNGYFSIKTSEAFNSFVYIMDATGRILKQVFLGESGNYSVAIPEVVPGVYFLVINNSTLQRKVGKIIIEK